MSSGRKKKRGSKLARPPRKKKAPDALSEEYDNLLPFEPKDEGLDDDLDSARFQRDKDSMMRAIGQAMRDQNFESEEEAQAFLSSLAGKKVDEIVDMLPESPDTVILKELKGAYEAATDAEAERLAHRAVKKFPGSIDAHLAHARLAPTLAAAAKRYLKAIALGEESLVPLIETSEGHLWGVHEARPWLNAKFELAEIRELQELDDRAADLYRELLDLNEGDNQGVRFSLMRLLLFTNRNAEARELYLDYEDDISCAWVYARALLAFRRVQERHPWELTEIDMGRSMRSKSPPDIPAAYAHAQPHLERALDANPYMAKLLLFPHCAPENSPSVYSPGSEEEARSFYMDLMPAWHADAAAYIWLFAVASEWMFENDCPDILADVPPPPVP